VTCHQSPSPHVIAFQRRLRHKERPLLNARDVPAPWLLSHATPGRRLGYPLTPISNVCNERYWKRLNVRSPSAPDLVPPSLLHGLPRRSCLSVVVCPVPWVLLLRWLSGTAARRRWSRPLRLRPLLVMRSVWVVSPRVVIAGLCRGSVAHRGVRGITNGLEKRGGLYVGSIKEWPSLGRVRQWLEMASKSKGQPVTACEGSFLAWATWGSPRAV